MPAPDADEIHRFAETCRRLSEPRADGTPTFAWWGRLAEILEAAAPAPSMVRFHVRIDDGPEQTIDTATGLYSLACIAAVATLTNLQTAEVEIWIPHLVDGGYGPYRYRVQPRECGSGFESVQLIRTNSIADARQRWRRRLKENPSLLGFFQ